MLGGRGGGCSYSRVVCVCASGLFGPSREEVIETSEVSDSGAGVSE